jgi:hypothetical protein
MDNPVTQQAPTGPAPVAPPAAAPVSVSPVDVQQRITEWMHSEPYQRGDREAIETVRMLYQLKNGQVPTPELSDQKAELTVPVGYDLPPIVRDDAAATIQELGLGGQAQSIFEFCLGHTGPPQLPAGYRPPTPEDALLKLKESEGQFAERTLDTARAAVDVLEQLRSRAGRPPNELRAFLDASGAGSDPRVIRFFSRLAGRFEQTEPALMKESARRRSAR